MRILSALLLAVAMVPSALAQNAPFAPFSQKEFTDVPTSHANFEAIESLRERNILRGYEDGTFKPGNRINRAEFVFLVMNPVLLDVDRMNECITDEDKQDKYVVYYPDVPTDAWFADAVCHATRKGLIKGYPDGRFRPNDPINFVEAAKIISSAMALQTYEEPTDRWFEPYVRKLSELRAIPTSVSRYGEIVTRGEISEMLYRLLDDIQDRQYRSMSGLSH